jgi:DNA-binding NtrC family response regulator
VSSAATIHSETLPGGPTATSCQLIVLEGKQAGRAVSLAGTITVGSGAACDLVLDDERVSERHVEIRRDGPHFVVRDLGSTNGTLYQGSLITEARVAVGATLKLGRSFVRIQPRPEPLSLPPSQSRRFGELVAESLAMRELFAVLELVAASEATVLVEGETGTGKELVARALHQAGGRRRGPFVAIDCGALPESLLESELFGHVRGAFTGAHAPREGAFARADGGTLFLDELGAVSPAVQARLLRALEARTVRPVGSDKERAVDVRVVAASRVDLEQRVAEGGLRADLYYRLSVVRVALPPLRDRREDLPLLVAELLRLRGLGSTPIEGPSYERLLAHDWPGNVRELRNVIDRALALSPGARSFAELRVDLVGRSSEEALAVRSDLPYSEAKQALLDAFEHRYLRDAWARHDGNLSAMARAVGLDRKHLRTLLRRQGLLAGDDDGG